MTRSRTYSLRPLTVLGGVVIGIVVAVVIMKTVKTMTKNSKDTDKLNVDYHLRQLTSEHSERVHSSLTWLIEHPIESHSALVEIVKAARYDGRTLGAIYALGQIGYDADVPVLKSLLTREGSPLVWNSAQALGCHKSPRAFTALVAVLGNRDPELVGAAAVALGIRGDESARKPLERLLEHVDESVRYRSVYALQKLGVAPSSDVLRKHRRIEKSADICRLIDEVLEGAGDG